MMNFETAMMACSMSDFDTLLTQTEAFINKMLDEGKTEEADEATKSLGLIKLYVQRLVHFNGITLKIEKKIKSLGGATIEFDPVSGEFTVMTGINRKGENHEH